MLHKEKHDEFMPQSSVIDSNFNQQAPNKHNKFLWQNLSAKWDFNFGVFPLTSNIQRA